MYVVMTARTVSVVVKRYRSLESSSELAASVMFNSIVCLPAFFNKGCERASPAVDCHVDVDVFGLLTSAFV